MLALFYIICSKSNVILFTRVTFPLKNHEHFIHISLSCFVCMMTNHTEDCLMNMSMNVIQLLLSVADAMSTYYS